MPSVLTLIKEPSFICVGVILLAVSLLLKYGYSTNVPVIHGIPEIPGALPFVGHLHLLGGASGKPDPAVWATWYQKTGWPVFQIRFGSTRVVVVNDQQNIREIWAGSSASSLMDRPPAYTVERYVGLDFGSMPWNNSVKRQRGAAIKSVAQGTWPDYVPMLERDSTLALQDILRDGRHGQFALNPKNYLLRVAMNLGFSLAYGKTLEHFGGIDFLKGIRADSSNWIDFIPILRLFPSRAARVAREGARNRQVYLDRLFEGLQKDLAAGEQVHCIAATLLQEKNSQLNHEDIKSTCVSMLQGATETVATTLTCGLSYLCSSEDGRQIQSDAYDAIVARFGTPQEAYDKAFHFEDVPYIIALYKEILRYYCIVPFGTPRGASKDFQLKSGAIIPRGTTLLMNAELANHETGIYGQDANEFDPHRWLNSETLSSLKLPHLSYGAGARNCPAWQLSNHILYGLLIRLIVSFDFRVHESARPVTHWTTFVGNGGFVVSPKDYLMYFVPRDGVTL